MEEKHKDNFDKTNKNLINDNGKNKILNIFLSIIVVITVITGSILYYSLYKYSKEEISVNIEQKGKDEVSTVADIIDTALNTNTTVQKNNVFSETFDNTTVTTGEADNRKILNESIIVLYDGLILDNNNMEVVELKYIDNSKPTKDNYVITYYNYENYGFKTSSLGTLSNQIVDGLVKINNVGKISISEKYEAIPREIQVINSIPTVVLDSNNSLIEYDTKKTIITDLDGNGTNEYILILANKSIGESKIILVESSGLIKATIAKMDKSGWDGVSSDGYYLSYNNIEIIDIDNDGIMEIIFEIPTTNSVPTQISLLKYKNGEVIGTTDYLCNLVK